MNNVPFDIAKNYCQEDEYIILYKVKNSYKAISIRYEHPRCIVSQLGEFSHIVQIPTAWILLSYNWQQEISNHLLISEILKQVDLLE